MEKDQVLLASDNIIAQLHRLNRDITDLLNKLYLPYGLVGLQHAFLTVVCRNPGVSQKELGCWFSLDLSNITRNIMHLEKIGYIRRERCENDKRSWLLYPTEKAKQNYSQVVDIFGKTTERLITGMNIEEIHNILEQMCHNLETLAEDEED